MIYALFVLNLINSYVIFDFMNHMYQKKYAANKVYFFGYVLFTGLHLFVNSFQIAVLNIVYEVSCIYLLGVFLYKSIPQKAIYNISFALYLIFMDAISFPLYSISLMRDFAQLLNETEYMIMTGAINYLLVICTYRLIIKYFFQRNMSAISIRESLFFLVMAIVEIVSIAYIWKAALEYSDVVLLLVSLSFVCLDLYILYLFEFVAKHTKLEYQVNLAEQQALMLNRNIHDLELKYQQSRKFVHDVRTYLSILDKLNANGERELADKYAYQLQAKLNELEPRFRVNNPIMQILINNSLLLAEEKHIEFKLSVQEIRWEKFADIDLTTLFANLFNNAIEACGQQQKGKRWIDFRLGEMNSHAVISLRNSYDKDRLIKKDGQFLSSKTGRLGIGLGNIKNVIEKYNGNMIIETQDDIFITKIIIPLGL